MTDPATTSDLNGQPEQPIPPTILNPYSARIEVSFPLRKSIYYSITEAELTSYSTLGWLATICLTLFGAFIGVAFGSWVALQQSNLPINATVTLITLTWVTGIVSVLFLVIAIVFIVIQAKSKKEWQPIV